MVGVLYTHRVAGEAAVALAEQRHPRDARRTHERGRRFAAPASVEPRTRGLRSITAAQKEGRTDTHTRTRNASYRDWSCTPRLLTGAEALTKRNGDGNAQLHTLHGAIPTIQTDVNKH